MGSLGDVHIIDCEKDDRRGTRVEDSDPIVSAVVIEQYDRPLQIHSIDLHCTRSGEVDESTLQPFATRRRRSRHIRPHDVQLVRGAGDHDGCTEVYRHRHVKRPVVDGIAARRPQMCLDLCCSCRRTGVARNTTPMARQLAQVPLQDGSQFGLGRPRLTPRSERQAENDLTCRGDDAHPCRCLHWEHFNLCTKNMDAEGVCIRDDGFTHTSAHSWCRSGPGRR